MNDYFLIANTVYSKLCDDLSRRIYRAGISYNLTKDEKCLDDTMTELFCRRCKDDLVTFCRKKSEEIYIFGIGTWGTRIYNVCKDNGIVINGWIDNSGKVDQKNGLKVLKPGEISNPDVTRVIVSVEKYSVEIIKQLRELGFSDDNIYDLGTVIRNQAKELELLQYFDLEEMKSDGHDVFVDCGAFDGMSTERFVQWADNKYDKIYMFEANTELYETSKDISNRHANCVLINKGVWNKETELEFYESPYDKEFNVNINDHNCLDDSKKNEDWIIHRIPVVKMDDVIDGPITFIKMDIEGSEAAAIEGAERLIRTYKPKCAISVYHKPDDLWVIPSLLLKYNPDYKFYLRHYSLGWGETVLYAL